MKKVLVSGGAGFIGSAVCQELLDNNYFVISIDDYSKYGYIKRAHDEHKNFKLFVLDVKLLKQEQIANSELLNCLLETEYIIHCAASIGGIKFFHDKAYDLLAENMRLDACIFDQALQLFQKHKLKRIIALASSMIMDMTNTHPTPESHIPEIPPPPSSYGFSKLGTMYFAKAAQEQYNLPYTIINPWNAAGIGEEDFRKGEQSHVIPDLILKAMNNNKELEILGSGEQVRTFTSVKDIARGIRLALESDKAVNECFNIANPNPISIKELGKIIWNKINPDIEYKIKTLHGFKYDTQKRIPDVCKARDILRFGAKISLEESIDDVINYIREYKNS
jgi:nucleoside-diphosphate-sugar epimerase